MKHKKPVTLNNWFVPDMHPFRAPEIQGGTHLIGVRSTDNKRVITSQIISINGNTVRTDSGTLYVLGTVEEKYLDWMKENNIDFDPANPIKFKEIDK